MISAEGQDHPGEGNVERSAPVIMSTRARKRVAERATALRLRIYPNELLWVKFEWARLKLRDDFYLTFSCNERHEVWPQVTKGLTPEADRIELQGRLRLLDQIVSVLLLIRPEGGRFRINGEGAILAHGDELFLVFE